MRNMTTGSSSNGTGATQGQMVGKGQPFNNANSQSSSYMFQNRGGGVVTSPRLNNSN